MKLRILVTGSTGFVGENLINFFSSNFQFYRYNRKSENNSETNYNVFLNLAGKSFDTICSTNFNEYYEANTRFSNNLFDLFLESDSEVFITLSSVKAVSDEIDGELTESFHSDPITHYGKSKFLAEQYILSKEIPIGKRVYILRPCMIHGPGNKGNLNLLYKFVSKGIPWPLGAFENKRSYCSIHNLLFIIRELIERVDISSGVYNVSDDLALSTNEVISIMAESQNKKQKIWRISKKFIRCVASLGDKLHLPLNTERLHKLTSSYVVSNTKIKAAIGKPLPVSSREGLLKTFKSFKN